MNRLGTDCIKCKRWKLFNDKPCSTHPDFTTESERLWAKAQESLDTMMYVAALRTTAYMGMQGRFMILWHAIPSSLKPEVERQVRELGPITDSEFMTSLFVGQRLRETSR